jgi:hypothetical protein
VVPVAGLLAETAVTLTEAEVMHLRRIAEVPVADVEDLLLSADRFVDRMPGLGITSLERQALLDRFGIFGIRLSAMLLRRGAMTATELSRELLARSGVDDLSDVLRSLFYQRRDVLKSRSALLALDTLVHDHPRPGGDRLAAGVEELVSAAHPFNELRVLSTLRAGWLEGKPDVLSELERVIGGAGTQPALRLDLPPGAGPEQVRAQALTTLERWQRRAENPLTGHELAVAARVAVRSCEGILAGLGDSR